MPDENNEHATDEAAPSADATAEVASGPAAEQEEDTAEVIDLGDEVAADDTGTDAAGARVEELPDTLTPGDVVTGTVASLVEFGAFVDVPTQRGTVTGLVHISEVAVGFVENIYAELGEGDEVTVKVVSIGDDGKVGLSIKQADPDWEQMAELDRPVRSRIDRDFDRRLRKFMHGSQSIQGEVRRQKRNKLGR